MTDRQTYYHSPKERPSRPSDPVKPTGRLVTQKGSSKTRGAGVDVYELPPPKKKYGMAPPRDLLKSRGPRLSDYVKRRESD